MKSVEFYCKSCGYKGLEKTFGSAAVCPECSSKDVVVASVWDQYGKKTAADTRSE